MTAEDVIRLTREHVERQFPKTCTKCGLRFESLVEYLRQTTHQGRPISFDAQMGDWAPRQPTGTLSLANCRCGTTLAIGSHGMGLLTMWRLLRWARGETARRGIGMDELLEWVRDQIDRQVLAEVPAVRPDP